MHFVKIIEEEHEENEDEKNSTSLFHFFANEYYIAMCAEVLRSIVHTNFNHWPIIFEVS